MPVKIYTALNFAETNTSIQRYKLHRTIIYAKLEKMRSSLEKSRSDEGALLKEKESHEYLNPFLLQKAAPAERIAKKKNSFVRRISPFVLLFAFLLVAAPYTMITHKQPIQNEWLAAFVFLFTMVNVLFADFALWNYFRGKRIFRIWVIEMALSVLIIHFLIQ